MDPNSLEIILDNRERDLIDLFASLPHKTENLPLGDIVFRMSDKDVLLIERKTADDLSASIKDGRYLEQKARIKEVASSYPCNPIYIIENLPDCTPGKKLNSIPLTTLHSCALKMQVRDKLTVIKTKDLSETFSTILKIKDTLTNKDDWATILGACPFPSMNKSPGKKSDKLKDPEVFLMHVLCIIPGMGSGNSKVIVDEFASLPGLLSYLGEQTDNLGRLKGLKGISKKRAELIRDYFVGGT